MFISVLALRVVPWLRSIRRFVSFTENLYPQPFEPVFHPFSWVFFTLFRKSLWASKLPREGFFKKYNMSDLEQLKDGAIQFILTNPDVHTICCRFRTFSDVEKYVRLSGTTLDDRIAMAMD